jgi:hypothetical protein
VIVTIIQVAVSSLGLHQAEKRVNVHTNYSGLVRVLSWPVMLLFQNVPSPMNPKKRVSLEKVTVMGIKMDKAEGGRK